MGLRPELLGSDPPEPLSRIEPTKAEIRERARAACKQVIDEGCFRLALEQRLGSAARALVEAAATELGELLYQADTLGDSLLEAAEDYLREERR